MGLAAHFGKLDQEPDPPRVQLDDTQQHVVEIAVERAAEVAAHEEPGSAVAEPDDPLVNPAADHARPEVSPSPHNLALQEGFGGIAHSGGERELLHDVLLAELDELGSAEQLATATSIGDQKIQRTADEQLHVTLAGLETELAELRAMLSQEQMAREQARAARDESEAAFERARLEMVHARKRQQHAERERAELQATLDTVLLGVRERSAALLVVARQAALIHVVLERAHRHLAGKGKRGGTLDDVVIAQEQLTRLRGSLDSLVSPKSAHTPDCPVAPSHDTHRVLPGLPALKSNPAVTANGASSNGHHELSGKHPLIGNGRSDNAQTTSTMLSVDIIICVHNALDDVQRCLDSVVRHSHRPYRLILVDDGSEPATADMLWRFVQEHVHAKLIRNDRPVGYTKAANLGLRAATGEVMVLLNSDTIVTTGWIEHLLSCLQSDPRIGIAGPLSNAASYQSVPERFDPSGDWALNPTSPSWDIDSIAAAVSRISTRAFPRVPFVNGFCFAISRAVLDAIGYLDAEGFPDGYGEENDFCLRAADAGFALAIADQAYVHHAKSRSYTHERRRALGRAGRATLLGKYGEERLAAGEARLRDESHLATMRSALATYLEVAKPANGTSALSVLFLLPVGGGGGGAHSVVQEARGMRRMGINAQVAIRALHQDRYRQNYPGIYEREELFFAYRSTDELQVHAPHFSIVVATIYSSMPLLAEISTRHHHVLPAYYIQDYEPLFYPEGSAGRNEAARSYTLIPDAALFAKTHWLCETVGALHNVTVHKVSPSLDHDVYSPGAEPRQGGPVRVVAMIRPSSARRGAGRTMKVLRQLTAASGSQVEAHIFGCSDADLATAGLPLNFPCINHGVLTREEVAATLRQSDVFLDLSDYQAFGRTGLEAMACGCAVVLPALGGTSEYAIHGENALLVDTANDDVCFQAAYALATHHDARQRLQIAGIAKAAEYSIERAVRSEVALFKGQLARRSHDVVNTSARPSQTRPGLFLAGGNG